jgi:uncharacterized protein
MPILMLAMLIASGPPPSASKNDGREFVLLLSEGRLKEAIARFDAAMSKALDANQLSALWSSLIQRYGAFKSIERVDVDEVQGYRRDTVICTFAKERAGLRVVIDKEARIAGFFVVPADGAAAEPVWTPPPYADAARFTETLVEVGPHHLKGAVTTPKGAARFPMIVMLAGSGPNDMDESLPPIKVFRDLAYGLGSLGVGSLRFEKRTHRQLPVRTVQDEYIDDARAAIDQAAAVAGATKVFLLGHSMGASMAPRVATGSSKVAGLILLAGSTWPYAKLIVEQLEYQKKLGFGGDEMDTMIAEARSEATKIDDPALSPDTPMRHGITGAYFLDLRTYDAVAAAGRLKLPIFIGWGEKDLKVIPDDFAGWKAKLGGRPNVSIHAYPGLQHLFTPVGTREVGHVSKSVVADLAAWISRWP